MAARVSNQAAIEGVATVGAAINTAATGVKLTYTCPAGRVASVRMIGWGNVTGTAPNIQLRVTVGGVTVVFVSSSTGQSVLGNIPLNAGDTATINCSGAGVGSTIDGFIFVEEFLAA